MDVDLSVFENKKDLQYVPKVFLEIKEVFFEIYCSILLLRAFFIADFLIVTILLVTALLVEFSLS